MKKFLKEWKEWKFIEIAFLIIGILSTIMVSIIFHGNVVDAAYTILYFLAALLLAKGKVLSYVIWIAGIVLYSIVSYKNHYFGEIFTSIGITLPLTIVGLKDWSKNRDESNVVLIKDVKINQMLNLIISQAIMYFGYYYVLKLFNTNNLKISALSISISVISTYLTAKRSEYGFIGFVVNDIILILLWGIPVIKGDYSLIPVLVCPILLFLNDLYGAYNWKKIKFEQKITTTLYGEKPFVMVNSLMKNSAID